MELRPAKAAFVAIDLQRGFCLPDGTLGKLGRDVSGCLVAAQRCVEMAGAARAAGLRISRQSSHAPLRSSASSRPTAIWAERAGMCA